MEIFTIKNKQQMSHFKSSHEKNLRTEKSKDYDNRSLHRHQLEFFFLLEYCETLS